MTGEIQREMRGRTERAERMVSLAAGTAEPAPFVAARTPA